MTKQLTLEACKKLKTWSIWKLKVVLESLASIEFKNHKSPMLMIQLLDQIKTSSGNQTVKVHQQTRTADLWRISKANWDYL